MAHQGDRLIEEQIEYYRRRAPEYDETSSPPGDPLAAHGREIEAALDAFRPTGRVLEIASGTGSGTCRLLRHASSVTALDSSPEMIELSRRKIDHDPRVRHVEADVFAWEPDDHYDVVFFSNWLSHVPPNLFARFWDVVRRALTPDGRVFFIDEVEDTWRNDESVQEEPTGHPPVPLVRRSTRDGRTFRVIKVFWNPADLEARLRDLDWDIQIQTAGPLLWGQGTLNLDVGR